MHEAYPLPVSSEEYDKAGTIARRTSDCGTNATVVSDRVTEPAGGH
jgi:hypothetical protein